MNDKPYDNGGELKDLINSAKGGSVEAFGLLRSRYAPLLESQIRRHCDPDMMPQDLDDMREEAFEIFCNAVCNFDVENGGVEFGLYAKICIENGLSSFLRSYYRRKNKSVLPLDAAENIVDHFSSDLLQAIIEKENTRELVRSIKKNLSDYENRVWWMYVSGMSVSEIASAIGGVEAKSVSNAIYRIRKKLRRVVSNNS